MVFLPRSGALKLLAAKETPARQAALRRTVFLNAQPISIWLNDAVPRRLRVLTRPDAPSGPAQLERNGFRPSGCLEAEGTRAAPAPRHLDRALAGNCTTLQPAIVDGL